MKTAVTQWGNSLAIRIPKAFASQIGIVKATEVELEIDGKGILLTKHKYNLEDLLTCVNSKNLHRETGTGLTVGKELW